MSEAARGKSRLLRLLAQGRQAMGSAHVVRDLSVTEIWAAADFDFVLIDMQHVAMTIETLQDTLIALRGSAASVMVRAKWNDPVITGQILDVGADAVIVPMVNTADQARCAVRAAKYPPDGTRSWGPRRTSWIGDADAYGREANDNIGVFTQVETAEAIANLDDILSVPGLAGVMVGPSDLAISLGYPHNHGNPAVVEAIGGVLDRCRHAGVPFGMFTSAASEAKYWLGRGAALVTCGSDAGFIAAGMSELAARLRDAAGQRDRVAAEKDG